MMHCTSQEQHETAGCSNRCCILCMHYENRSGFCRYDVPQVIQNKDGYYVSCFPKIACPMLDYCSHFKHMCSKQML